jgi:hypothetical protein
MLIVLFQVGEGDYVPMPTDSRTARRLLASACVVAASVAAQGCQRGIRSRGKRAGVCVCSAAQRAACADVQGRAVIAGQGQRVGDGEGLAIGQREGRAAAGWVNVILFRVSTRAARGVVFPSSMLSIWPGCAGLDGHHAGAGRLQVDVLVRRVRLTLPMPSSVVNLPLLAVPAPIFPGCSQSTGTGPVPWPGSPGLPRISARARPGAQPGRRAASWRPARAPCAEGWPAPPHRRVSADQRRQLVGAEVVGAADTRHQVRQGPRKFRRHQHVDRCAQLHPVTRPIGTRTGNRFSLFGIVSALRVQCGAEDHALHRVADGDAVDPIAGAAQPVPAHAGAGTRPLRQVMPGAGCSRCGRRRRPVQQHDRRRTPWPSFRPTPVSISTCRRLCTIHP